MGVTQVRQGQIGEDQVTEEEIADTGITPGAYDLANVTLDPDGRATLVADGKGLAAYLALIFG